MMSQAGLLLLDQRGERIPGGGQRTGGELHVLSDLADDIPCLLGVKGIRGRSLEIPQTVIAGDLCDAPAVPADGKDPAEKLPLPVHRKTDRCALLDLHLPGGSQGEPEGSRAAGAIGDPCDLLCHTVASQVSPLAFATKAPLPCQFTTCRLDAFVHPSQPPPSVVIWIGYGRELSPTIRETFALRPLPLPCGSSP